MKSSLVLTLLSAMCALAAPTHQKRAGTFQMFGINESGGEFPTPQWPSLQNIDALMSQGYNTFRILFTMEHMTPTDLSKPNMTYLGPAQTGQPPALMDVVNHITDKNCHAIIVPWNFGRYNNQVLQAQQMQTFWTAVAAPFASNEGVIFDTNNEYHDIPAQTLFDLNQAAINGIRAANATNQLIMVEGNDYTKASDWVQQSDILKDLKDPANSNSSKIIYEMHQYLDPEQNASDQQCVRGKDALVNATNWLNLNKKQGFIGEFAAGNTANCSETVTDMLNYMATEKAWLGALWWGGGQANDAQHFFAFNPTTSQAPSSQGYNFWDPVLQKYM